MGQIFMDNSNNSGNRYTLQNYPKLGKSGCAEIPRTPREPDERQHASWRLNDHVNFFTWIRMVLKSTLLNKILNAKGFKFPKLPKGRVLMTKQRCPNFDNQTPAIKTRVSSRLKISSTKISLGHSESSQGRDQFNISARSTNHNEFTILSRTPKKP